MERQRLVDLAGDFLDGHPPRLGLPPLPQPGDDFLLRPAEDRVGGQRNAHRHRLGRVIGGSGHGPTVSTAAAS
ncbi:hypothetical protein PV367_12505 [Streptomyces europaeiscabiei]|uniref:Uncharacterized protein n=1 Tax=Streptomyces europaeiscabiei TaxID=146819 RepID=A0AAJ2PP67_9ACTN|nr:hypothetical protein [Streptomyces europaeiscabiei]MDX3130596.1 hypothetical protein [Streptomyces europaeiscabiei]